MSEREEPRYPLVFVDCTPIETDELIGLLTMLGAEGIEERDATTMVKGGPLGVTLVASFSSHELAEAALLELGDRGRMEELVGDAWRDGWKAHWKPTKISPRIVVVPSWETYEKQAGEVVLQLDPGNAFGTGQHASTALAASAIDRYLAEHSVERVLDVGCGSGILALVAVLLGAKGAEGCDTDPESVTSAIENAERVGLLDRVKFSVGSAASMKGTAPLVVANIETPILVAIADPLSALVAAGGKLILSGVLATQREQVTAPYLAKGFVLERCEQREDWICPELTRGS